MAVSTLSLTVAKQSGWYSPNFTMADPLYWGKGKGCAFTDNPCLSGSPPTASSSEFCTTPLGSGCDLEHTAAASCFTYTGTVSNTNWDYFGTGTTVASDSYSDNCPWYVGYSNRICGPTGSAGGVSPEYFGTDSACFYSWVSHTSMNYPAQGACYQFEVNNNLFYPI